jgi:cytochrome c553
MLCVGAVGQRARSTDVLPEPMTPPAWLFPVNPPGEADPPADPHTLRVPDSPITFTAADLDDLFSAPDWHPSDHPPMPQVVAQGRKPGVYACGYCHLPDGGGRPENASLAGLPATYIVEQVAAMRTGTRRTAVPTRVPPRLMSELSARVTDADVDAAAGYFSKLQLRTRINVIETDTVPRTHVAGWILALNEHGPREPIGERIVEVPEDVARFEHRDSRVGFVAYVPVGAIQAGRALAAGGASNDNAMPCSACHGADLKGTRDVPGIAGRSPSYLMRQLFDIRTGLRAGKEVEPMTAVVQRLSPLEMIQLSSYLATLR